MRGFTLIELLTVVLIIGILTAIALPWYQSAVDASRYTQLKALVHSVKNAAEVAFMQKGEYPTRLDMLDVSLPTQCTISENNPTFANCGKFYIDFMDGPDRNVVGSMNPSSSGYSTSGDYVAYVQWLNNSSFPQKQECRTPAGSTRMQKLCEGAESGVLDGVAGGEGTECPACQRYWLP